MKRLPTIKRNHPLFEPLEQRMLLSGLTIITHGYELSGTAPSWLFEMADTIANQDGPSTAVYDLQLNYNSSDQAQVDSFTHVSGPSPSSTQSSNAETVVLIDWAEDTGLGVPILGTPYFTTTQIANLVMPYLVNTIPSIGITEPLAQGSIQLIGHSRGGSLVSEIAKDLGQSGIWVDQLTTLDPDPVMSDPTVSLGSNIIFADNYYQTSGDGSIVPNGTSVPGAVNLGPISFSSGGYGSTDGGTHSDVHLFYQGTIGNPLSTSDGTETVPTSWYPDNGVSADTTGFYYSRIVGGTRPLSGVSTLFGGYATRVAVTTSGVQWPDIGDIEYVTGPNNQITFFYRDQNDSANPVTINWFQDSDTNPYNSNNVTSLGSQIATFTGSDVVLSSFSTTYTGNPKDIYAQITDGTNTRFMPMRANRPRSQLYLLVNQLP